MNQPITVAEVIAALSQYPSNAYCYAYEGEITGIVIVEHDITTTEDGRSRRRQLGEILTEPL